MKKQTHLHLGLNPQAFILVEHWRKTLKFMLICGCIFYSINFLILTHKKIHFLVSEKEPDFLKINK